MQDDRSLEIRNRDSPGVASRFLQCVVLKRCVRDGRAAAALCNPAIITAITLTLRACSDDLESEDLAVCAHNLRTENNVCIQTHLQLVH